MKKFLILLFSFFCFFGAFAFEKKEFKKKDEFLIHQSIHFEVSKTYSVSSNLKLDERICDKYDVLEKAKYDSLKATSKK